MLVAERQVSPQLQAVVQKACELARIRAVGWHGESNLAVGSRPALVISALPAGERMIGDELVRLMTRVQPGMSLLMLCSDELIRPTVSLQGGRVTLLGPPLTEERVAARLRILLADKRSESSVDTMPYGVVEPGTHVFVHEQSTQRAYFAVASTGATEPVSANTFAPLLDVTDERVSALLSVSGLVDDALMGKAVAVVLSEDRDEEKEKSLLTRLGPDGALVNFSGNDWSFYWPAPSSGLFLASSLRLPQVWSFAHSLGRTGASFLRAQAASGDVLVALWGAPWPVREGVARRDDEARLLEAALSGGPQMLDLLVERLEQAAVPVSGLVVEVR